MVATAPNLSELRTEDVCSTPTRFNVGLELLGLFDPDLDVMHLAHQAVMATSGDVPASLELLLQLATVYACDHGDAGAGMLLRAAAVVQQLQLAAMRRGGLL